MLSACFQVPRWPQAPRDHFVRRAAESKSPAPHGTPGRLGMSMAQIPDLTTLSIARDAVLRDLLLRCLAIVEPSPRPGPAELARVAHDTARNGR